MHFLNFFILDGTNSKKESRFHNTISSRRIKFRKNEIQKIKKNNIGSSKRMSIFSKKNLFPEKFPDKGRHKQSQNHDTETNERLYRLKKKKKKN